MLHRSIITGIIYIVVMEQRYGAVKLDLPLLDNILVSIHRDVRQ
jgi:hypothetical protein